MVFRILILIFIGTVLQSCPENRPTYESLMRDGDDETRALLEQACGADMNSRRCRAVIDPSWINRTLYTPSPSTNEYCQDCQSQGVQSYLTADADPNAGDFKEGCEILEGGITEEEKSGLMACFNSIRASIAHGIDNSEFQNPQRPRNGESGLRDRLFCAMYRNLRPEEQHFAGMMFTTVGEGRSIMASRHVDDPKYQEGVFIQKTVDNRIRSARQSLNDNSINALDIALARSQFSMYNDGEWYKDGPKFFKLWDPLDRSNDRAFSQAIDAFSAMEEERQTLESGGEGKIGPRPNSDNIGFYYNPHGMAPISSLPAGDRAEARERVRRLKAAGKIPSWHPSDRVAPAWNFSMISVQADFSFDGETPNTRGSQTHVFYRDNDGQPDFGGRNKVPPRWKRECGGSAAAE